MTENVYLPLCNIELKKKIVQKKCPREFEFHPLKL